jgi:hypothetical protein
MSTKDIAALERLELSTDDHRVTQCWRVGEIDRVKSTDPCFAVSEQAHQYAIACSLQRVTVFFGVWHYETGTNSENMVLPVLVSMYLDGDGFHKGA